VATAGGPELEALVEGAKLLRADLVLASGSPLGAPQTALVPAAISIELLHLASLVHDDVIDCTSERRGVPALHVVVGHDRALVLGDLLIVTAFAALRDVPPGPFARCWNVLAEGAQRCCSGQLDELDPQRRSRSEEEYLDLVARKTGALFATAAGLGALVAGADDVDEAALAAFGSVLGVAYQIRDDLCDGAEPGRFEPTPATYARAIDRVSLALERVPTACGKALREMAETVLGAPVQVR